MMIGSKLVGRTVCCILLGAMWNITMARANHNLPQIESHIELTLGRLAEMGIKADDANSEHLFWKANAAKILLSEAISADKEGRSAVAEELARRAREFLVPAMKRIVDSGLNKQESRISSKSEKRSDPTYPPLIALKAFQAMEKAAHDIKEIKRISKVLTTIPDFAGRDPFTVAREVHIGAAALALMGLTDNYPELARFTLARFYSSLPGSKPAQTNAFVWDELNTFAVPREAVEPTNRHKYAIFVVSLSYAPIIKGVPLPDEQVSAFVRLRNELNRRWNFYSQLTEAELCDYVTSTWTEEGIQFDGRALASSERNIKRLTSPRFQQEGEQTMKALCSKHSEIIALPPGSNAQQ